MKKNNKPKFVIVSCRQRNSGGAVVLHKLCKMLEDKGYDARIYYTDSFNYSKKRVIQRIKFMIKTIRFIIVDTFLLICVKIIGKEKLKANSLFNGYAYYQVKGCKRKKLPIVDKNTIVVYPEVVRGNFLNAEKVIRWFLYFNNYLTDSEYYDENDKFICYRQIFNDWNLNPDGNNIYISSYDLELYKQTNYGIREGCCYIIRKGSTRKDLPTEFNGPIIDKFSEIEKVEMFNKYKYCYCYDTQTAYVDIAALCGCIPIVVPEKGKTRLDYLKKGDHGYGVAYGKDEIQYAIKTREKLIEVYKEKEIENNQNIDKFIKLCKQYYKELDFDETN